MTTRPGSASGSAATTQRWSNSPGSRRSQHMGLVAAVRRRGGGHDTPDLSAALLEHKVAATPTTAGGRHRAPRQVRFVYSNEPVERLTALGERVRAASAKPSSPGARCGIAALPASGTAIDGPSKSQRCADRDHARAAGMDGFGISALSMPCRRSCPCRARGGSFAQRRRGLLYRPRPVGERDNAALPGLRRHRLDDSSGRAATRPNARRRGARRARRLRRARSRWRPSSRRQLARPGSRPRRRPRPPRHGRRRR